VIHTDVSQRVVTACCKFVIQMERDEACSMRQKNEAWQSLLTGLVHVDLVPWRL